MTSDKYAETIDRLWKNISEARGAAEVWRDIGCATWFHEEILLRDGHHLVARGYVLPGHRRRVFTQAEAVAELGIGEPRLPWEKPRA